MSYSEALDVMAYAAYSHANLSETKRFPTKLNEALNVLRSHDPAYWAAVSARSLPVVSPI